MTSNACRHMHDLNRMSFTRCQFENWIVITAYDCMVMHQDVCWNGLVLFVGFYGISYSVISRTLIGGGSYPSAGKQSVYSTAPADWAIYWNDITWRKKREKKELFFWRLQTFWCKKKKNITVCWRHYEKGITDMNIVRVPKRETQILY